MKEKFSPLAGSLAAAANWLLELGDNPIEHKCDPTGIFGNFSSHDWLVHFTYRYVTTQNPIYAWRAVLASGAWNIIPDWALIFLEDQGHAVLKLAFDTELDDEKKLSRLPAELGFSAPGRRGNAFRNHREYEGQAKIAVHYKKLTAENYKPYLAREVIAADEGISKSTVKNYVDAMEKNWEEQTKFIKKTKPVKK